MIDHRSHLNLPGMPNAPINFAPESIRLADLLIDATTGSLLTSAEQVELDTLLRKLPRLTDEKGVVVDDRSVGMVIGATIVASAPQAASIPEDAKARLLQRGREIARENASADLERGVPASELGRNVVGRISPGTSVSMSHGGPGLRGQGYGGTGFAGWLVAAAAIAFAALTYVNTRSPSIPNINDRATALIAQAGTVTIPWTPMGEDNKGTITGNVIWNNEKQTGFIKFRGVTPNDPAIAQFQLWVFDKKHGPIPTTAGVFDVRTADASESAGEYIVEIKPALNVANAEMFAISVEKPGGAMSPNTNNLVMTAPLNK